MGRGMGILEEEDDEVTFGCVEFKMLWTHPNRNGQKTAGEMVLEVRTFWLETQIWETLKLWIACMRSPSDSVLKELAGAKDRTAGCTDPKKGA